MKILLTGANGFIGSHLVKRLLDEEHELLVIKRQFSDLGRIKEYVSSIQFYNYEDTGYLDNIFQNQIDVIVHLAGVYIKNDSTPDDIHRINSFNIDTAAQLAYRASMSGVNGFINTGTFFEYDLSDTKPLQEDSPIRAFNYYAASKLAFAEILKYLTQSTNLKAITLKLFSPYGPKDNDKIIPLLLKSAITQKSLQLQDTTQQLSFTYIDDIVEAYIKAITYLEHDFKYEDFNIGSDKAYSIRELITAISDIAQTSIPVDVNKIKQAQGKSITAICNNSKAKDILHWQPKTDLRSGLAKTYEYYKNII